MPFQRVSATQLTRVSTEVNVVQVIMVINMTATASTDIQGIIVRQVFENFAALHSSLVWLNIYQTFSNTFHSDDKSTLTVNEIHLGDQFSTTVVKWLYRLNIWKECNFLYRSLLHYPTCV